MAAMATNVRRLPGPILALLGSVIFVALALLILRVTLNPNEEAMQASAEAARPQREAVQVRTRAPTDASTTTESTAATDAAADSGLPSVGDTHITTDDLSVTLLAVEDMSELPQLVGDPVDPRRDYFRIVTIKFENNSSDPTTVQNTNIWLVKEGRLPHRRRCELTRQAHLRTAACFRKPAAVSGGIGAGGQIDRGVGVVRRQGKRHGHQARRRGP